MTKQQIIGSIRELPRKEQVDLVQELWQLVDPNDSELTLPPALIAELDSRREEFEKDATATRPWSQVKAGLERQLPCGAP